MKTGPRRPVKAVKSVPAKKGSQPKGKTPKAPQPRSTAKKAVSGKVAAKPATKPKPAAKVVAKKNPPIVLSRGQKAAATRKANQLKAKRSAAAKKGAATRKAKQAAAKLPAKRKAPAAPAPGTVLHAGIRYRRQRDRDRKGTDMLFAEVTVLLRRPGAIEPSAINEVLQEYVQTGELPSGVRRVDVISWNHGRGAMGHAETRDEIDDAREELLSRIAPYAEFIDMGRGEGMG